MRNVFASCVLLIGFGGKRLQNCRTKKISGLILPTVAGPAVSLVVCKCAYIPQLCRNICSTLSTAFQSTFSDQFDSLYPLSTGPTISTDKLILSIVERSC